MTNTHSNANALIAAMYKREALEAKPIRFAMKRNADSGTYLVRIK